MRLFYVLGHQGGWDEILMVIAPIIFVFCLLVLANKRAKKPEESDLT